MSGCCEVEQRSAVSSRRTGPLAAVGALLSAVASSACCWLPLLLLAFGASATGLSAWFEQYRLPFLIAAGLMLAFSFYSVYFRAQRCEPGSACATTKPAPRRVTKSMLWVTTVFVVGFAAFPRYVGALLPGDAPATGAGSDTRTVTYSIEGMTCEACAVTLAQRLRGIDGILEASVSYSDRTAAVVFAFDAPEAPSQVAHAAGSLGYTVTRREAWRLNPATPR